jgi:hypothetical protein
MLARSGLSGTGYSGTGVSGTGSFGAPASGARVARARVAGARVVHARRTTDSGEPFEPAGTDLPLHRVAPRRGVAASRFLPTQDWDRLLVLDDLGRPTLYLQAHGGELWLTEPSTGRFVTASNDHLPRLGIWTIWLRNVDSRTIVAREGLLQPGAIVDLVREPGSADDPTAIAVHAATGRPVGYVSRGIAAALAPALDAGRHLVAVTVSSDPRESTDRPGLVKVLAAAPDVIEHLFRRLPNGSPIAPAGCATVPAG